MKDPVRLLDGDGSEAERALLRAAVSEEPPADGPRRLAAALGVSIAPLSMPPTAAGGPDPAGSANASAAQAGTPSTAPAPLAGSVASKLAAKWLLLAGAGAAIAGAALVLRGAGAPQPQSAPRTRPSESAPSAAPAHASDRATTPAGDPAAQDSSGRSAAVQAGSKSIAREIEQLDLARGHLQRGQARAALDELDAYLREHPAGVLAQEAALLRIEALASAGERGAARRHGERFLREHPGSPHASRIRALLGGEADAR